MSKRVLVALSLALLLGAAFLMRVSYHTGLVRACNMLMVQMIPAQFEPSCKMQGGRLVTSFSSPDAPERTYDVETGAPTE